MTDMANHSHYGSGAHFLKEQTLAYRIRLPESVLCQHLVDHYIARPVLIGKESAFAERDAHDLEVVGGHGRCQRDRQLAGWWLDGGGPIAEFVLTFAHGDDIGKCGGFDSRHSAGAIEDVPPGGTGL